MPHPAQRSWFALAPCRVCRALLAGCRRAQTRRRAPSDRSLGKERCRCAAESRNSASAYAARWRDVPLAPPSVETCQSLARQTAALPDLRRSLPLPSAAAAIQVLPPARRERLAPPRAALRRLSTELVRNATQVRTVSAMPLRFLAPKSSRSKRSPSSFRVLSAQTWGRTPRLRQ
jgi:hypothetical protein